MMTTNQDQHQAQATKAQDLLHRAADLMDERGKQYDQRSGEARLLGEEKRRAITREEVKVCEALEAKAAHEAAELLAQRVKAHQAAQEARYAGL